MTDHRDRLIRGLMVPADVEVDLKEPETLPLREWLTRLNFEYFEMVRNTGPAIDHDFVMMVDEDGYAKQKPWNPRAQFFSEYPLHHLIVGDALFISEAWGDDGFDLVDLTQRAERWLTHPDRKAEFSNWM